jgi:hypothetical protein
VEVGALALAMVRGHTQLPLTPASLSRVSQSESEEGSKEEAWSLNLRNSLDRLAQSPGQATG